MKKILFFIAIALAVQVTNAQGILQFLDHNGNYITNGQKLFVFVEDLNAGETVSEEYYIRNNSNEAVNVKCVRTTITAVEGSMNYFCALGTCLAPGTDETPNPMEIPANTTTGELGVFSAHYMAMGNPGLTLVNYKFYNIDNPNDSISFSVTFSDVNVAKNSLVLFDTEGIEVAYGQNIEVNVEDLSLFETVSPESFIKNNSDRALNLVCKRTVLEEVEGSTNYFCALGQCLPAGTDQTPVFSLDGNTQIGEDYPFSSHYTPDNNPGITKIHYRYYDIDNEFDEFSFTVTFDGTTGVNEISQKTTIQAYPNPASEQVQFNISDNEILNAQLVIYNAVGEVVKVIQLNNQAFLNVNITDLSDGVYLYRLENGSQMSKTSKLIIR